MDWKGVDCGWRSGVCGCGQEEEIDLIFVRVINEGTEKFRGEKTIFHSLLRNQRHLPTFHILPSFVDTC